MPFIMPPVRDDANFPIWLGSLVQATSDSKIELPKGYSPQQLPPNVDLKYDFAEYHSSYSQDHSVIIAKRRLLTKLREVPIAEFDDYRSFLKNLENDVNRYVYMSSSGAPASPKTAASGNFPSFMKGLMNLPDSNSSEANKEETAARDTMKQGDPTVAVTGFKHAVELDPKFTRAWLELVVTYMINKQPDLAINAARKAIDSDPKQLMALKTYAFVLTNLHRFDSAIDAWRECVKLAPDDHEASSTLGGLLLHEKRYAEAVPYLETAVKSEDSPAARMTLARAYLRAGQVEKGQAILEELAHLDPNPGTLNNVAYELAEANTGLPKALEYAQRAVDLQEKQSHDVDLSNLLAEDLSCTRKIGMFWDTLGWVYFRLGNLDKAGELSQRGMAVIAGRGERRSSGSSL